MVCGATVALGRCSSAETGLTLGESLFVPQGQGFCPFRAPGTEARSLGSGGGTRVRQQPGGPSVCLPAAPAESLPGKQAT